MDKRLIEVLDKMGFSEAFRPDSRLEKFYKIGRRSTVEKQVWRFNFTPEGKAIYIVPLGDVHRGHKCCLEDLFQDFLNFVLEQPDTYTILTGDLFENATRESPGKAMLDEEYHITEQRRRTQEDLAPLVEAGKVLGGVGGNHCARSTKFNGEDPMGELCYDLDIPYFGYSGFLKLVVGQIIYHVHVAHGAGTGGSSAARVKSAEKGNSIAIADLYISGHTHDVGSHPTEIYYIDDATDKVASRTRTNVVAGSFLDYFGGYAEEKMLAPTKQGAVLIRLSSETKDIRVTS